MRIGTSYYPEHWPAAQWATDAQGIRALGLEIVRMAEFSWFRLEPEPGRLDLDWLEQAIGTMADAGLRVVLGTPTATPPAWLVRGEPEILPVDAEGRRRNHGGRRHYCPTNASYRAHSRRIVTALGERFGRDDRVIAWQIDNEFGGSSSARCYCPACAGSFREWLRARYGGLDALNDAWGTPVWSQVYTSWEQITPPILQLNQPNPGHALDYRRFASATIAAFAQAQVEVLRDLAPGRPTYTNTMGLFPDVDSFELAATMDLAGWDSYPTANPDRWAAICYADEPRPAGGHPYGYDVGDPYLTGFAHTLTRGLRNRPFWVVEQQAGHVNWGNQNPAPREGTVRLWTWHAAAAGADTVLYYHWRAAVMGQEQYHSGLVGHDGSPDIGSREVRAVDAEREALARVVGAPAAPRVALLFSYADLWALELQPHRAGFSYLRLAFAWFRALARLGIAVDIIPAEATQRLSTDQQDLGAYELIVAPTLHVAAEPLADELAAWVGAGGHLVLGVRSGMKTTSNRVTTEPLPGPFHSLVGATVTDWHGLPPGVSYALATTDEMPGLAPATVWAEALEPTDPAVRVRGRYADGPLAGRAAVTERRAGAGLVTYLGIHPTVEVAAAVLRHATDRAGIERLAAGEGLLPDGLLAVRRGGHVVMLNFTDEPADAAVGGVSVTVGPRDAAVVPA